MHQTARSIALTRADGREDVSERRLADLLPANPIYVALEDSLVVASATMLDRGISWLPVVKSKDDPCPVGRLRGDRITRRLMEKLALVEAQKAQLAS